MRVHASYEVYAIAYVHQYALVCAAYKPPALNGPTLLLNTLFNVLFYGVIYIWLQIIQIYFIIFVTITLIIIQTAAPWVRPTTLPMSIVAGCDL